jgi:hypothetical protein
MIVLVYKILKVSPIKHAIKSTKKKIVVHMTAYGKYEFLFFIFNRKFSSGIQCMKLLPL